MIYKVTKQFVAGGNKEQPCGQFKTMPQAQAFVAEHAESDAAMKIQAIYRIYEFDDLLETVDSRTIQSSTASSDNASDSQGMQSGASFRPSPLEMAPRPKGTPAKVWVEPKDDKGKDK